MDARGFHRRLVELAAKIDLGETWDNNGCMAAPLGAEKAPKINYPRLYISGKKKAVELPEKGKAIVQYKVTGRSMNQRDGGEESHSADVEIQSIEPMDPVKETKSLTGQAGPKEGEAAKLLHDLRPLIGFGWKMLPRDATRGDVAASKMGPLAAFLVKKRILKIKNASAPAFPTLAEPAKLLEDLRPLVGLTRKGRENVQRPTFNVQRLTTEFDDRSRNDMGQFLPTDTGGVDPNSMAAAYGVHPLPEPPAMNESHLARIKKFFAGRRQRAQ